MNVHALWELARWCGLITVGGFVISVLVATLVAVLHRESVRRADARAVLKDLLRGCRQPEGRDL